MSFLCRDCKWLVFVRVSDSVTGYRQLFTLIKIIAGVLNPDQGFVRIRGKTVDTVDHNVAFMRQKGVEVGYQDLAIVPNMSAPYNLFLGRIPRKFGIFVDEKKMLEKTKEVLAELNIETVQNLNGPISEMSGGQQQSIAIGRAIAWGKDIVILDEPTAALGPNETLEVERVIHEIRTVSYTHLTLPTKA